jgi:hypothetical protein
MTTCEYCLEQIIRPSRTAQRFCCSACSENWHMAERREAVAWYRACGLRRMIWPFNNNSSWADKVEVHNNERKTSTYFTQARIAQELEAPGGRFAEVERPMMVGAEPVPAYPGSGGPWNDPVIRMMHEPPTGFAVDAQEPTGTAQEIERSLSALAETSPVGSATRAEPAARRPSG